MVFRDPQGLLDGRCVQPHQPGSRRSAADRSPGAVGLVHRMQVIVPAARETMGDLIARNYGGEHLAPAQAHRLAKRHGGREDLRPLVTACIDTSVVAVEAIRRTGVCESRSGNRRARVVQQDGGSVSGPGRGRVTRPAIANERQSMNERGQVIVRFRQPFREGTTNVVLDPLDFIACLAALVPRPRRNLTRSHGACSPRTANTGNESSWNRGVKSGGYNAPLSWLRYALSGIARLALTSQTTWKDGLARSGEIWMSGVPAVGYFDKIRIWAIVTLKERDALAVKKRIDALSRVRFHLADVGRQYGGRFWLFGSASRGDVRKDSDIDLVADFPIEVEREAIGAAERICAQANVPCDIVEKRTCSDRFWAIVSPDLKAIP